MSHQAQLEKQITTTLVLPAPQASPQQLHAQPDPGEVTPTGLWPSHPSVLVSLMAPCAPGLVCSVKKDTVSL